MPVNVTLLFSPAHYLAQVEAYTRGIERRVEAGLPACVASVASVFISRWDGAVAGSVPADLSMQLGIAIGMRAYADYRAFIASDRWQRLLNVGARPQRLLFASTGTKDPTASDVLYVAGLAAPLTVNTMPEETLLAFADHGSFDGLLPAGPAAADDPARAIRRRRASTSRPSVGELQRKGAASFVASWTSLLERIAAKVAEVDGAAR